MKRLPRTKTRASSLTLALSGTRSLSLFFIALSCGLLLLSMTQPASLEGLRTGVADMTAPLLATVNRPIQDAATAVNNLTGMAQLQAENERLRQENMRLRTWYQTAQTLVAENRDLKKLMNVAAVPEERYVTAPVIADSGGSYARSLLVAAGRTQGVQKGQAVLSGDGLIGRVVETGKQTARILLMTDVNARIPVMIAETGEHAIMAGTNNSLPALQHLPPGAQPENGMRIITSGHGGLLPYGLPIGQLLRTKDGEWTVEHFASMNRLHFVRIVDRTPITPEEGLMKE